MQRELDLADIEGWARTERRDRKSRARAAVLQNLIDQIERDRRLPQPDALTPGSPERLAAQGRQRRIRTLATTLGYRPAGQEAALELVEHAAIEATGLPGLAKAGLEAASEGAGGSAGTGPDADRALPDSGRSERARTAASPGADTVEDRPAGTKKRRRRRHGRNPGLGLDPGRGLGLEPW